jgi:putative transcriptional regulator
VEPTPGRLLVATPALIDPNFWRTVILVIHGDDDGHVGLILNRPTLERVEDHLIEWTQAVSGDAVVHFGGPVEPDVAITLISGERGESTGLSGVSLGDIEAAPGEGSARVYAGYAGWGGGQLDAEIAEGAWVVVAAEPGDPFDDPDGQWQRVLHRQGGRLGLMANYPLDATLN